MFDNTRPAELDPLGGPDPWSPFRVALPAERLSLLRALRDGSVPVVLNAPDGTAMTVTLWALDAEQGRMNLSVDAHAPQLAQLVDADEAVAVAYLEAVKLQFDLQDFMLVHGAASATLQCRLPDEIYRFQRRNAYRVRTRESHGPQAVFRHPSMPEMQVELRVLDVSIGGCALLMPDDMPPLEPGLTLQGVRLELDPDTRVLATLHVHHITSMHANARGVRLGCELVRLDGGAERALQRYIDQAQKRRRLLSLS